MVCLEFPDTLEALEVDDATELEEDILDNVERVDTGDIVDVLPNPPTPTPPKEIQTLIYELNIYAFPNYPRNKGIKIFFHLSTTILNYLSKRRI